jgi:hypothetical protein
MRRSSATGGASSTTPNLLRDLYQVSGIAETIHMDHIKRHYYGSHKQRNPTDIVPVGLVWQGDRCFLLHALPFWRRARGCSPKVMAPWSFCLERRTSLVH